MLAVTWCQIICINGRAPESPAARIVERYSELYAARSWCDRMNDRSTPINVAVDSVAFLVAMLAWLFLIWGPILVAFALFYLTKTKVLASVLGVLVVTAICFPLGLGLRWLARGIIQRKRTRLGLSAIVLGLWGILYGFVPLFSQRQLGPKLYERLGMGILFLCSAAIAALGSTRSTRWSGE